MAKILGMQPIVALLVIGVLAVATSFVKLPLFAAAGGDGGLVPVGSDGKPLYFKDDGAATISFSVRNALRLDAPIYINPTCHFVREGQRIPVTSAAGVAGSTVSLASLTVAEGDVGKLECISSTTNVPGTTNTGGSVSLSLRAPKVIGTATEACNKESDRCQVEVVNAANSSWLYLYAWLQGDADSNSTNQSSANGNLNCNAAGCQNINITGSTGAGVTVGVGGSPNSFTLQANLNVTGASFGLPGDPEGILIIAAAGSSASFAQTDLVLAGGGKFEPRLFGGSGACPSEVPGSLGVLRCWTIPSISTADGTVVWQGSFKATLANPGATEVPVFVFAEKGKYVDIDGGISTGYYRAYDKVDVALANSNVSMTIA